MKLFQQRFFCLLPFILALTACATLPAPKSAHNEQTSWSVRQRRLNHIQHFTLSGLINLRDQSKAESANVVWRQNRAEYNMSFFGPLGMDTTTLIGKPGKVTLEQSNGQKLFAKTPEALLKKTLGWTLPVSNLTYWVRGLTAPQVDARMTFDQFNHLKTLDQQGWQIVYIEYTAVGAYDLPSKMTLSQGNLKATLIISQWQLRNKK